MKFIDINKREHKFELDTSFKLKAEDTSKSSPQFKLGRLLASLYNKNNIFEDYPLPGCGNLSWDFWVPHSKIAFEFHGRQHFEYVKFFHQTKNGFSNQINADKKKAEIAALNGVTLIVLSDDDLQEWSKEELLKLIVERLK
jgi:hypothetical protein